MLTTPFPVLKSGFGFKRFQQNPDRGTKDEKHTGRPKSQRTAAKSDLIQNAIQEDPRRTVREFGKMCGMSKDSALQVLRKDLKLTKIALKFDMKLLTDTQRQSRIDISNANLAKINSDPSLLKKLIATDESWCFTYDPRTKQADMQWVRRDQPRPRKLQKERSQKKCMVILCFDWQGIIWIHFVNKGTVNSAEYIQALRGMREALRKKRPALWRQKDFILLQDNAGPHKSDETMEYFQSLNMDLWSHPAYSPDLSPCDFFAFPEMKKTLRGHRFQTLEDLQTAV